MKILDERQDKGHMLLRIPFIFPYPPTFARHSRFWLVEPGARRLSARLQEWGRHRRCCAYNNKQLLYYAFLMIMNDPWLRQDAPRDLYVSLGIVQPNFYGVFEAPDVWETTLGYVMDWGHNELLPRMNALVSTQDLHEADYVPGDHCQFCPVLLDCVVMQRAFKAYADASEDFIVMLTNQELNEFYSQREYARRFMNALESAVHARLVAGGNIPSAKLVEKRVARVWKPGAAAALEEAFGSRAYEERKIKEPGRD